MLMLFIFYNTKKLCELFRKNDLKICNCESLITIIAKFFILTYNISILVKYSSREFLIVSFNNKKLDTQWKSMSEQSRKKS